MSSASATNTPPLFPRAALHPAVLAWADAHARDDAPWPPWCVAFSGGADSLALLITLCDHWPERRAAGKIVALHFNHHLRGGASDADEQFCRSTAAALGIEIRIGHWTRIAPQSEILNLKSEIAAEGCPSEAAARDVRHDFFAREMTALKSPALFLGHQLDDIAETQLMRLARGSSAAGLAAPRPVHERADGRIFLRPLLTLSKKHITGALLARGLAWREDATNTAPASDASGNFFRNRIRRDVLPAYIAAAENDVLAGAALTRELLEEDAAALDAWLDELLSAGNTDILPASDFAQASADKMTALPATPLDLRPLANKPRALLRRALRRWPPAAELARTGFEALLAICETRSATPAQTSIGDHIAIFENGILRLAASASAPQPHPFQFSLALSQKENTAATVTLPDNSTITAAFIPLTDELRERIFGGEFDPIHTVFISPPAPKTLPPALTIRSRQPGDRYQLLGAPGVAKLSDLFINRKIPHAQRLTLPVICTAPDASSEILNLKSEILWVPGLPPAHAWKITTKTPQALRLTYQRGTCTVPDQSIKS